MGITRCIAHALAGFDVPVPHADDLEWCIGPPLRESFVTLVGEANASEAVARYRERFAEVGLFENTPYPGAAAVLKSLHEHGHRLYVASSKPQVFVERILERFGLDESLLAAFGAELDGTRSAKPELLAHALATTRERAADATMIGDRKHDVIGALANGAAIIGARYGYGTAEELRAAGATHLIDSIAELHPS